MQFYGAENQEITAEQYCCCSTGIEASQDIKKKQFYIQ